MTILDEGPGNGDFKIKLNISNHISLDGLLFNGTFVTLSHSDIIGIHFNIVLLLNCPYLNVTYHVNLICQK